MSARFWTAAEILRGLDDEFADDKLFSLRLPLPVYFKSDIEHHCVRGLN